MTRSRRWSAVDIPDQTGRTFVVTGANGGIGLATTAALTIVAASPALADTAPAAPGWRNGTASRPTSTSSKAPSASIASAAALLAACGQGGDSAQQNAEEAVNATQDMTSGVVGQTSAATMGANTVEGFVTNLAVGNMYELQAAEIAQAEAIPRKFLEQIMAQLQRFRGKRHRERQNAEKKREEKHKKETKHNASIEADEVGSGDSRNV